VALLGSLAHHAAIALENASLFQEAREAVARWQEASARVEQQNTVLERAAALHEQLMRLVLEGAPVSALAEAVAATMGGEVLLLDANGVALTHTPDLQPTTPRDLEAASAAAGRVYEIARSNPPTQVVAVQAGSRRLGFLLHRGDALLASDVRALERASMVTALLLLDRSAHDEARVRAMGGVFGELVSHEQRDPSQVRRRALAAGVTVPTEPCVAAVALAPADGDRVIDLDRVALLAVKEGWLVRVEGRQLSLLMHGRDATATAKMLAARLTELVGEPMTVGAAGPTDQLAGLSALLARAQTCAKVLETTGRRGSGATAEDLGVYALLFSDVGRERIEEFVRETIGPVQEWDNNGPGHLVTTLEAYFEQGGQTGRLAEALYVHVNTLYQRLDRIDRLLSPDWRRGEQALQVHLAVRLARLLTHPM
jgi:DNA-binding PucR family transcriptional regulator